MNVSTELPRIASRDEWLAARLELLRKEKELTRAARRVERRASPAADGEDREGLSLPAPWRASVGWPTCSRGDGSSWCTTSCGSTRRTRDARAARCRSTRSGICRCTCAQPTRRSPSCHARRSRSSRRIGRAWGGRIPLISSAGSDFNYDFHGTLDPSRGATTYNFRDVAQLGGPMGDVRGRPAGSERVPARRTRRVPHVLGVRARHGAGEQPVRLPRLHAARPAGRQRAAELGAAPRSVRRRRRSRSDGGAGRRFGWLRCWRQ